jgi:hypothetical protein
MENGKQENTGPCAVVPISEFRFSDFIKISSAAENPQAIVLA